MRIIVIAILSTLLCGDTHGQISSYETLKGQLAKIGYDTGSMTKTYVIVSDQLNDQEANQLKPFLSWWETPLSLVNYVFSGNKRIFEKHFSQAILNEHDQVFLDKEKVIEAGFSKDYCIKIFYTENEKILKEVLVHKSNIEESLNDLKNWQYGFMNISGTSFKNGLSIGDEAPSINKMDLEGNQVNLDSLTSKVILLNFWSKGCSGCIYEMPMMNQLYEEYSSKGILFYSIYRDSESSLEKYFTKGDNKLFGKNFVKFPIIADAKDVTQDYKIQFYPFTYIINPEGKIAKFTSSVTLNDNKNFTYQSLKGALDRLILINRNSDE